MKSMVVLALVAVLAPALAKPSGWPLGLGLGHAGLIAAPHAVAIAPATAVSHSSLVQTHPSTVVVAAPAVHHGPAVIAAPAVHGAVIAAPAVHGAVIAAPAVHGSGLIATGHGSALIAGPSGVISTNRGVHGLGVHGLGVHGLGVHGLGVHGLSHHW